MTRASGFFSRRIAARQRRPASIPRSRVSSTPGVSRFALPSKVVLLYREGAAASATARGVGIVERKTRTHHRVYVVDLNAVEILP